MWLTYLYYYLGAGLVLYAVHRVYRVWRPRDDDFPTFFDLEEKKPSRNSRLFDLIVVPVTGLVIFLPLWPLLFSIEYGFPWHRLKFWSDKPEKGHTWIEPDPEPVFAVTRADLLERLTLADIEAAELVDDPLHAVPDMPFGHLNKVWQTFVDGMEPGSELWSFRGRWKTQYRDWQLQGYVALHGEKIGPYFCTKHKFVQKPERD